LCSSSPIALTASDDEACEQMEKSRLHSACLLAAHELSRVASPFEELRLVLRCLTFSDRGAIRLLLMSGLPLRPA
jgi:hypothetical protein